jgi:N-acetylmuramic acid 6-phosphate etherase
MDQSINKLTTEQRNEITRNLDQKSAEEILRLINKEDSMVPGVVAECIPDIANAVNTIVESFKGGGRLLYFGAGTSGRLGILDASECPPTFGTDPEQVQGIIAGGYDAIHRAVEGAEDSDDLGANDVDALQVNAADVVVGIAASGRTPYVLGAMKRAQELGATVIGIANNNDAAMKPYASIMIEAVVGPEVVLGSTRMKSGTAQKMILNMLTTTAMILSGKVYDNLMVDMLPSNIKLILRSKRLIQMATGADPDTVERVFEQSNGHVKTAIVMILAEVSLEEAIELLQASNGFVREAIRKASKVQ